VSPLFNSSRTGSKRVIPSHTVYLFREAGMFAGVIIEPPVENAPVIGINGVECFREMRTPRLSSLPDVIA
jgi:hypothetical protein